MLEKFSEDEIFAIEKEVFSKYNIPYRVPTVSIDNEITKKLASRFTFHQKNECSEDYKLRKSLGERVASSCIEIVNFTLHNYIESKSYARKDKRNMIELFKFENYKKMLEELFEVIDRYCM